MRVGSRRMFVSQFTMLESRSCVLLCLCLLTNSVMVLSLMVMMRGGMVSLCDRTNTNKFSI
jgi:hypothetical protein